MSSFIFESDACRHCEKHPRGRVRRVLRTTTEDICCSSGAVVQTFPASTSLAPSPDIIMIPEQVSQTLAKLLKLRLFVLDEGIQPQRVKFSRHQDAQAPVHRVGDQMLIELWGRGNTWAELRWSYSLKDALPQHPWERLEYISPGKYAPRLELKPKLEEFEYARPPRIERTVKALSGFDLTSAFIEQRQCSKRILRLEQRCPLAAQPLDTSELTLVVKVELAWIQVGTRFPDETGAREFYVKAWNEGMPRTLEEAIDYVIDQAMWFDKRTYDGTCHIHHPTTRHPADTIVKITNPCQGKYWYERGDGQCGRTIKHRSRVQPKVRRDDFFGPFKGDDGIYLVPAGEVTLDIDRPTKPKEQQNPKNNGWEWGDVHTTILQGEEVLLDTDVSGRTNGTAWFNSGFGHHTLEVSKTKFEAGQTLSTRINDLGSAEIEEKKYRFVTWNQYHAAWHAYRAQFIDAYKTKVSADAHVVLEILSSGQRHKTIVIDKGSSVAVFFAGRWVEATYVRTGEEPTHYVRIKHATGERTWHVAQCLPLEDALMSGLDVAPPYDPAVQIGFHHTSDNVANADQA